MNRLVPSVLALTLVAALTSCGEPARDPVQIELETSAADAPAAATSLPDQSAIDGWGYIDASGPALLPPSFTVTKTDGVTITAEDLQGDWTIIAFWGLWSEDSITETRYLQALDTAVRQDPDLNLLTVHTPPLNPRTLESAEKPYGAYLSLTQGLEDQGWPLTTTEDAGGRAAQALSIPSVPHYLLLGPDLAIEARRGPISLDDTDGIKPMIRGVAEIKAQIVSAQ